MKITREQYDTKQHNRSKFTSPRRRILQLQPTPAPPAPTTTCRVHLPLEIKRGNSFCANIHATVWIPTVVDILVFEIGFYAAYSKSKAHNRRVQLAHSDATAARRAILEKKPKPESALDRHDDQIENKLANFIFTLGKMVLSLSVNLIMASIITRVCRDDYIKTTFNSDTCHACKFWEGKSQLDYYNIARHSLPSQITHTSIERISIVPSSDEFCAEPERSPIGSCAEYFCYYEQEIQGAQAPAAAMVIGVVLDEILQLASERANLMCGGPDQCLRIGALAGGLFTLIGDLTAGYSFGVHQDCRLEIDVTYTTTDVCIAG